jgi:biopolymer transport protein ExbD
MAMATGGKKGHSADINMTPMIDILLVLLIIFMVVQQELQKGLSLQVPPIETEQTGEAVDQIVLEVLPNQGFRLNQQPVSAAALEATLTRVFAPRPRKVIFIRGEENAVYGDVVFAVDTARNAGIEITGLVPRSPTAPPGS